MTSRGRKLGRNRRGAAMAELAILLPVFLFVMMATIDYARLFSALATLSDCARDGALYYASHVNDLADHVTQATLADATNLTNPVPTVTLTKSAVAPDGSSFVSVRVDYQFSTLFVHPSIPHVTELTRTVTMPVISDN